MRLTRSRDDIVISGLLGGVAEYFNVDPTLVRIIFVVIAFVFTPIPVIPLYIVGMLIVPKAPSDKQRRQAEKARRKRMDRAFEETDMDNQESSKQTNTVTEDDWSDF